MAATGGRDDHAIDLRDHAPRPPRVVLAAVPPRRSHADRPAGRDADPGADPDRPTVGGRVTTALLTAALAALCLVVVDTAAGILPDRSLADGVPVLSFLTVQRLVVAGGLLCLVAAAPRPRTFLTPVDLPLLALVALAGVALASDGQSMAAWRALVTAVAVFYLAVGILRRHANGVPVLLVTVLGAAFVASAIGVQQYVEGVDTGFYRVGLTNSDAGGDGAVTRSTGTFSNPNLLAGYLVVALPLTVGLLIGRAGRPLRVAWLVLAGIGAAGLVVTFSRGAVAAFVAVAVAGVAVASATRRGPGAWPAVVAVGGAGLAAAVAGTAATGVLGRATGRDELWSAALAAARTGGLDGSGYGRAGDVMSAVSGQTYAHAHNLWLNWLVDTGPLGPVLISLVLGVGLVAGLRRAFGGSVLAAGAVTGLAGVTLASVLDHPTTVSAVLTLVMVTLACAVAGPTPLPGPRGRHSLDPTGAQPLAGEPAPGPIGADPGLVTGPVGPVGPAGPTRGLRVQSPPTEPLGGATAGRAARVATGPSAGSPAGAAHGRPVPSSRAPGPVSVPRRLTQDASPPRPHRGPVPPPAPAPDDTAPLAGPRRGRRAAAEPDGD